MKKLIPFAILAALIAGPVSAQDKGQEQDKAKQEKQDKKGYDKRKDLYKVGSTVAETVKLLDLRGEAHTFKELRGKTVVVTFWSNTCPWMKPSEPKLIQLQKDYAEKDVVVIGIASNRTEIGEKPPAKLKEVDSKEAAHPYASIVEHIQKNKVNFPVYADHGNRVADLFQATSTPHCFVIDAKGVIRYAGALDDDAKAEKGNDANYVRRAIDAVQAGKTLSTEEATTKPYGCSIKRVAKADKKEKKEKKEKKNKKEKVRN